jgi:hypothetical protein
MNKNLGVQKITRSKYLGKILNNEKKDHSVMLLIDEEGEL